MRHILQIKERLGNDPGFYHHKHSPSTVFSKYLVVRGHGQETQETCRRWLSMKFNDGSAVVNMSTVTHWIACFLKDPLNGPSLRGIKYVWECCGGIIRRRRGWIPVPAAETLERMVTEGLSREYSCHCRFCSQEATLQHTTLNTVLPVEVPPSAVVPLTFPSWGSASSSSTRTT